MSSKNPTIKDVAKEAGVSIATVSRVVNSLGTVNLNTTKKVNNAILKLNYKKWAYVVRRAKTSTIITQGL